MSRLVFVRHAQASLFSADYDMLSERGHSQAKQLADFWTDQGLTVDALYTGPCRRHRETAEYVEAQCDRNGIAVTAMPEFDENQVDRLITQHMDTVSAEFPHVAQLHREFRDADEDTRQPAFSRMFLEVAGLWTSGRCVRPGVETAVEFRERVNAGVDQIVDRADPGQLIVVVTSVGPIAAVLQRALHCSDSITVDIGWRIRNCSVTEFVFGDSRFTLDCFNSLAHLDDRQDWTYW